MTHFVKTEDEVLVNLAHVAKIRKTKETKNGFATVKCNFLASDDRSFGTKHYLRSHAVDVLEKQLVTAPAGYALVKLETDEDSQQRRISQDDIIAFRIGDNNHAVPVSINGWGYDDDDGVAIRTPSGQIVAGDLTFPDTTAWVADQLAREQRRGPQHDINDGTEHAVNAALDDGDEVSS